MGPYVLAGVGHGAVIAHELGVQLRAAGEVVQALVVLESGALREAWEACSQPWIQVRACRVVAHVGHDVRVALSGDVPAYLYTPPAYVLPASEAAAQALGSKAAKAQ
jgi:thioesterase domain-containing protein